MTPSLRASGRARRAEVNAAIDAPSTPRDGSARGSTSTPLGTGSGMTSSRNQRCFDTVDGGGASMSDTECFSRLIQCVRHILYQRQGLSVTFYPALHGKGMKRAPRDQA